jgi:septation ring formation regulator EzrA
VSDETEVLHFDIYIDELERLPKRAPGESRDDDALVRVNAAKARARERIAPVEAAEQKANEAARALADVQQAHAAAESAHGDACRNFEQAQAAMGAAHERLSQVGVELTRLRGEALKHRDAAEAAKAAARPACAWPTRD